MTKGATLLLAIIVLFTFPVWIGLIAGGFGLVIGIVGGIFGVIAGVFGTIFGIIGGIFDAIFGSAFGWSHGHRLFSFPHFHLSGFQIIIIILIVAFVLNRKKSAKDNDAEQKN